MKLTQTMKYLSLAAATTALLVGAQSAQAQTESISVDLVVQNTLTILEIESLNYGTIVAIGDGSNLATAIVSSAGAITIPASAGTAVMAIVDSTSVSAAQLTVADGADGATLNVQIDITTLPTDGVDTFDLTAFETTWNGGTASAQADGVSWTETFDEAFGSGTNTLDIGATLSTQVAVTAAYTDNSYVGDFTVTFSY